MTRKEEIRSAAQLKTIYHVYETQFARTDFKIMKDFGRVNFEAGAEWADKHPAKPENKRMATIDMWVARDKSGDVYLWDTLPFRNMIKTCNYWEHLCGGSIKLSQEKFPTVTWKNSPKKVKVTIELMED